MKRGAAGEGDARAASRPRLLPQPPPLTLAAVRNAHVFLDLTGTPMGQAVALTGRTQGRRGTGCCGHSRRSGRR